MELLLTIFRMAALEWFAAVDISSSDSAIKVPTVMHSLDYIFNSTLGDRFTSLSSFSFKINDT